MSKKEETLKRLNEDVQAGVVGDIGTVTGLLEYLGLDGKPLEEKRTVVQAFITGAPWARPVLELIIPDLRDAGIID